MRNEQGLTFNSFGRKKRGYPLLKFEHYEERKMGAVSDYLQEHLTREFAPTSLEVINESHLHAGHHGHDGEGETHLRIRIVADAFAGMNRVARHRAVFAVVQAKIDEGLHACAIEAKAPGE